MIIKFARGDSYERGFILKDTAGATITDTFDDVYFTVKTNSKDRNFKIQKRLSDGGITDDGEGHYTLFIVPEDTNDLQFGDYDFDIEFVKQNFKRTFYGVLTLTKEVTHQYNE